MYKIDDHLPSSLELLLLSDIGLLVVSGPIEINTRLLLCSCWDKNSSTLDTILMISGVVDLEIIR